MKKAKRHLILFISLVAILLTNSCIPEDITSSPFTGVWVRTLGPSGDKTDLAIGLITDDPTRVYMCEKRGSTAAGFYKGYLFDNIIEWDAIHQLPDTELRIVGSQLEFFYPSVAGSLPTLYNPGNWSAECGPLTSNNNGITNGNLTNGNLTTGKFSFWVQSDLGCGNITVVLNGVSKVISNYHSISPECSGDGSANFELPGGTYNYTATCSGYSWANTITVINGKCSTRRLTL